MNPWDDRYGTAAFFYGTEPNDFLRERFTAIPASGSVLCLGEGEGRNAVFLAERGYRVTALDQSPVGLEKARRLASARGVTIDTIATDLAEYSFDPGYWDGIVSIWCHLPSDLRSAVHRRIRASLKSNGAFLLEAYTPQQIPRATGGPKAVDLLPSLAELKRDLEGLELTHAIEREREVHEGSGHSGLSSVVQIVARNTA